MIDHIGIAVTDTAVSKAFFTKALAPLGYVVVMEFEEVVGMGVDGKPDFWMQAGAPGQSLHVAFHCENRKSVDAFYHAAIAAGGKDNGGPGLRPHYHPNYYGAFVFDPDGNNIEAVCHAPT